MTNSYKKPHVDDAQRFRHVSLADWDFLGHQQPWPSTEWPRTEPYLHDDSPLVSRSRLMVGRCFADPFAVWGFFLEGLLNRSVLLVTYAAHYWSMRTSRCHAVEGDTNTTCRDCWQEQWCGVMTIPHSKQCCEFCGICTCICWLESEKPAVNKAQAQVYK